MARPEKFTVTEIIAAIRKAQTAAGAARILECDSDTIRNYAKRHATVDRALYNEREDLADYAEMGLKRAVLNGEAWAIALAVKTLRKGVYSERQEVAGANGGPLALVIEYVNDWRSVSDQSANQDATDDYADARR